MARARILTAQQLRDAGCSPQIIDARTKSEYEAGHIPGAIWMRWEEWCSTAPVPGRSIVRQPGYWGALKDASVEWYAERLSRRGLRSRDPIVVYADGPESRGSEGRCAWMLLYLGARSVAILNGGWAAWQRMGGPVSRQHQPAPHGEFSVSFRRERRRTVTELGARWEDDERPLLVDTRSGAEYAGDGQYYLPRRGHIPGADLVPFQSLYDAGGAYMDARTYLANLPHGVQDADDVVAYCEVGVRAAVFALMHEAYTGRIIPVCDGSLVEWALTTLLPLRTGLMREQDGPCRAAMQ